jgi:hypothetical protein
MKAVRADAPPALLTRARAALEARERSPRIVRWAMQPLALAASLAIFVASAGLSFALISSEAGSATSESATLMESLLEERGIEATAVVAPAAAPDASADSGDAR